YVTCFVKPSLGFVCSPARAPVAKRARRMATVIPIMTRPSRAFFAEWKSGPTAIGLGPAGTAAYGGRARWGICMASSFAESLLGFKQEGPLPSARDAVRT